MTVLDDILIDPGPTSVEQVLRSISGSRVVIFSQDLDLIYRWVRNPAEEFSTVDFVGKSETDILPEAAAAISTEFKQKALTTGKTLTYELPVMLEGTTRFFEVCVHPEFDADGKTTGLTGSAIDVSDERHQAQTLAALIMEVSHRSRNLLAIVQSIAVQTAQSESSIDAYRNRFVGRLQSLSRTQDIITASDWQGADADELVRAQLGGMGDFVRLSIAGANASFAPSSALHFGLAVHELATNAREGTISAHDRQIVIELVQTGETEHPLRFRWHERVDGREPSFGAFAKSILERAAPQAVDGHAELDVSDEAMLYQLHIGEGGLHGRR